MIRAAFFDLDGTLLSHRTYQVSGSTKRALAQLRDNGVKLYLSTGRHAVELDALPIEDLIFDGYITLNGQLCLDQDKQFLYGTPFPEDITATLISLFQRNSIPLVLVEESGLTLNYVNQAVLDAQSAINTPVPEIAPYDGKPIYQATAFATRDQDEFIRSILPQGCRAARWSDHGVDLIMEGGGKVSGMRYFLEREGILPGETIAFGDAENDIDMLEYADIGVVMGNAQVSVKRIANYITSSVDEDGIDKALRYYGLIEG